MRLPEKNGGKANTRGSLICQLAFVRFFSFLDKVLSHFLTDVLFKILNIVISHFYLEAKKKERQLPFKTW